MSRPEILRSPGPAEVQAITAFVERCRRPDGSRALADHLWIDLQSGSDSGAVAVVVRHGIPGDDLDPASVVGYAQASMANEGRSIEIVVDRSAATTDAAVEDLTRELLDAVLAAVGDMGGGPVTWWVVDPSDSHHRIAVRAGLGPGRELLQMRRRLPTGELVTVETRPFVPGADDEAWLAVNNRAFAAHGEQGGWDLAMLRSRFDEPWFDPDGFLIHEADGRMLGFCWTKLHHDIDPPVGEIYVIAVDPDTHGRGLGSQLTLAGLESIHRRGIDEALLYVDAHNTAAVTVYQRLGFTVNRRDLAFTGTVAPR